MNKKYRVFESLIVHRVQIKGQKISLFNESAKQDTSVTSVSEQEIVKWIFENSDMLGLIIKNISDLNLNEFIYELEVKNPLLSLEERKIIGDIDAVIVPKNNPEKAIIIEFKRIKINTLKDKSLKVNKVSWSKNKGFSQIKKLSTFKYHKTYLGLILEEDSRNIESPNTVIRNSQDDLINEIYNINNDDSLSENAGLFFIRLNQPTGENFKSRFNFAINVDKFAKGIEQNTETTKRVLKLINS